MRVTILALFTLACMPHVAEIDEAPRAAARDARASRARSRPARAPAPRLEEDSAPGGASCEDSSVCGEGLQCRGPVGCTSAWACGSPRACGDALVSYCGCDGATFYAPANCPGAPFTNVGPCAALGPRAEEAEEGDVVEGNTICTSDADCTSGLSCAGLEGCATFWTCTRRRRLRCGRETSVFCGCDGATFTANSRCPGRPYVHRGECGSAAVIARTEGGPLPAISPRRQLGDPR